MQIIQSLVELIDVSGTTELEDRIELSFIASDIQRLEGDFERLITLGIIRLTIDSEPDELWSELDGIEGTIRCTVIIDKERLLNNIIDINVDNDVNQILFITENFLDEWINSLESPFCSDNPLYRNEKTILWVKNLSERFIGPSLSIIPLDQQDGELFSDVVTGLPSDIDIRSQVHFLSIDSVKVDPIRFKLPDSASEVDIFKPIFKSYEKLLVSTLIKEYFASNKVIVSGIKRISLSIIDDSSIYSVNLGNIKLLEGAVSWVYVERTETRLLLMMDRISLDLPEDGFLLPSIYQHLEQAFDQARCRYEFVIKDRKEAHAKELADLQKDIKAATDSYSKSTHELISGFLKDALSTIFILAIALFSRLIGKEDLLRSENVYWLFYFLSAYLIFSAFVRILFDKLSLRLSLSDLNYWKDTTRNHMSQQELNNHINKRTKPYKRLYFFSTISIAVIYIALAYFSYNLPNLMVSHNENSDLVVPAPAPAPVLKNDIVVSNELQTSK